MLLLENFADVDHRAYSGQTALMRASRQGELKTCEWLLAHGASLDKKDIYGKSALLLAAQEGWISMDPAYPMNPHDSQLLWT
jgi:ankyrin repeat protein